MRLACPSCGALCSLDAWSLDLDARKTLEALVGLSPGLAAHGPRYLALFRRPGSARGLTWPRARALAEELLALVSKPTIQWEGRRILDNCPEHWLRAVEQIFEKDSAGTLTRPLKSHNLLRTIAYSEADKANEAALRRKEEHLRHQSHRPEPTCPAYQPAAWDSAPRKVDAKDLAAKAAAAAAQLKRRQG